MQHPNRPLPPGNIRGDVQLLQRALDSIRSPRSLQARRRQAVKLRVVQSFVQQGDEIDCPLEHLQRFRVAPVVQEGIRQ